MLTAWFFVKETPNCTLSRTSIRWIRGLSIKGAFSDFLCRGDQVLNTLICPYLNCSNTNTLLIIWYVIDEERDVFDTGSSDRCRAISDDLDIRGAICNCLDLGFDSFVASVEEGRTEMCTFWRFVVESFEECSLFVSIEHREASSWGKDSHSKQLIFVGTDRLKELTNFWGLIGFSSCFLIFPNLLISLAFKQMRTKAKSNILWNPLVAVKAFGL